MSKFNTGIIVLTDFQTRVLMLDTIIENQREMLTYVRQNSGKDATGDALEELFTRPLDSAEEMDELCLPTIIKFWYVQTYVYTCNVNAVYSYSSSMRWAQNILTVLYRT